jgi:hypothetical protein
MTPDDIKSGEAGFRVGNSLWHDPYYRKLMGLPPRPFEKGTDMGYYRAGDSSSYGIMMSDQNPAPSGGDVTYITAARQKQLDKGGGYAAPRHRMNVGNVRALRRSMRRVTGFAHLARKVMTFTTHHKLRKARKRK